MTKIKQEAWILFLRIVQIEEIFELLPFWGRVAELQKKDIIWAEDIKRFICIEEFHKELDMLVIDNVLVGNPDEETLHLMEQLIVEVTNKMFDESDFEAVGKKATKGFRKNSVLYPLSIPDCIKGRFGITS